MEFKFQDKTFVGESLQTLQKITRSRDLVAMEAAIGICSDRSTVVQAGGHYGVYPWLLSKAFKNVITFEATPNSYKYLVQNLEGCDNITHSNKALGAEAGKVDINVRHTHNSGGNSVVLGGTTVDCITIDSLNLTECDLLYLDVEGFEYNVLKGAAETVKAFKPVIVVEYNSASDDHNVSFDDLHGLIISMGYKLNEQKNENYIYKS